MVENMERDDIMKQDAAKSVAERSRRIVKTSVIGIVANVLLVVFKIIVGLSVKSIAIVMDAVNNLSDAASSVITIVGAKLAGKPADKKHPFGHGRIEYLSAMVISIIVLYAGVTALIESVKKIIDPDIPDYSVASLIIVSAAVVVKIVLGRYVKSVGEKIKSDSLINSGKDALLDSVISASTLVSAAIFLIFGLSLEAWLGALISVFIIRSGLEMLRETLSKILGEPADVALAKEIRETLLSHEEISGVYDMIIHDYGPDTHNGSVHIEVPDTFTASDIDLLNRKLIVEIYYKYNVILTAIGIYSINTRDKDAIEVRENIRSIVMNIPYVLQMHGFYLNREEKTIRFDVVISFDAKKRSEVYESVIEEVQKAYPDHALEIALDTDYTQEEMV